MKPLSRLKTFALIIPVTALLITDSFLSFETSPILYLPFNKTVLDESAYKNSVKQHGGVLAEDRFGRKEQCLEFDGINDYLEIADKDGLFSQQKLTFTFWFNSSSTEVQNIIGKEDFYTAEGAVYQLFINWSNYPGIGFNIVEEKECYYKRSLTSSYVHSKEKVKTDTWYFVSATWDGKEQRLYVDGNLVDARKPNFTALRSCNTPLRIGIWYQNSLPFKGKIDDVRIFKRVLNARQMKKMGRR